METNKIVESYVAKGLVLKDYRIDNDSDIFHVTFKLNDYMSVIAQGDLDCDHLYHFVLEFDESIYPNAEEAIRGIKSLMSITE